MMPLLHAGEHKLALYLSAVVRSHALLPYTRDVDVVTVGSHRQR